MPSTGDAYPGRIPLWAVFALDPKAAALLIDAVERETHPPAEGAGYATASNLPDHIHRARLLMEYMEGNRQERDIMLSAAYGFVETQRAQDEVYS